MDRNDSDWLRVQVNDVIQLQVRRQESGAAAHDYDDGFLDGQLQAYRKLAERLRR